MKKLLLYLLTIAIMVSCSESGTNDGDGNTPTTPTITLNTSSVSFDEFANEESISFSATADWIAEIVNDRADGWLSITPQSGTAGDASITIKAKDNDTPDERNASVRIKAGTASKTIAVSQKQKDALTVTSSKFEVGAEGGEVKIEVKANIDFEYAIDESAKEWVKYEGTRAMKTSTLTFSVAENDDIEKREGKIAIKSGEFNEVVTIYQAGDEPTIVISQNEYVVSSDGETVTIEVTSNVNVAVEMPADVDWISENTTRATSTNTYYFDIQPNEDYDQRTAEIKFTNKENGLSETVKIVQTQKDALVVAKDSYTVNSEGDQIEIEVGHNVDFDIEISADWITKAENTRAFLTETLNFNIAKNPTTDNREGTIVFKSKDGKLTQTVKVYQAQEDALIISKKDIVVSDEGGSISFELQTNVDFKVSDPDVDWLRPVTTRGLTTHTLNYTVDANTSYDSREAHIIVTDTKNNKSETITITQAQKDAIVLAKDSYTVNSDGDQIEIEVGHNVDFDIEIDCDWITKVDTRAFVTETLTFDIAENSSGDSRKSKIIFKSKDGALTQLISIEQSGQVVYPSTNEISIKCSSSISYETFMTLIAKTFGGIVTKISQKNGWYILTLSDDSTIIPNNAFKGFASNLKAVIIGNGVTSIGEYAFYDCDALESVTIPDSVTSIGESAFARCDALKSVIISNSVTEIGDRAFYRCTTLESVIIPDSVTSIGESAFSSCYALESVTIPDSVTSIGKSTFSDCDALESVTIPDSVTSIRESAFAGCDALKSVIISNSVTEIGESAFIYCTALESVTIPDSVTTIYGNTFSNCKSLYAFYGKCASSDNRCLIIDGELVTFAPRGLTSYTIPDSVTSIGEYAFYECDALESVIIPDSVTSIGKSTFSDCDALESVIIPDSVTSIGEYAFYGCDALHTVYCKPLTPPYIYSNTFTRYNLKFYVPVQSLNKYKSNSAWKDKYLYGYYF